MNDEQKTNLSDYIIKNVKDGKKEMKIYDTIKSQEIVYKSIIKSLKGLFNYKLKVKDNEIHVSGMYFFSIYVDYKKSEVCFKFTTRYDLEDVTFPITSILNYDSSFLDFITDKKYFEYMSWELIRPLRTKMETSAK